MPAYNVASNQPIPPEKRDALVNAITDIHCSVASAPELFVQVLFTFGVPLRREFALCIQGAVRGGRTDKVKEELERQMRQQAAEIMDVSAGAIQVELLDIPACWVMEGGEILPDPGDEEAWLAKHAEKMTG